MVEELGKVIVRMEERLATLTSSVSVLNELIKKEYATKSDLEPIKNIVYGGVAIVLVSVFTSLLYLVLKR